jgi:hypothetical protein
MIVCNLGNIPNITNGIGQTGYQRVNSLGFKANATNVALFYPPDTGFWIKFKRHVDLVYVTFHNPNLPLNPDLSSSSAGQTYQVAPSGMRPASKYTVRKPEQ